MRGIRWTALALLGGCTMYFGDDDGPHRPQDRPDAASVLDGSSPYLPGTCAADVSLALIDAMLVDLPIELGLEPTTVCLRLDTTARTHPTFVEAQTPIELAPPSAFGLALYDATDQLVAEGYDAPLSNGHTYATVATDVLRNGVFFVKLVAWARQTAQRTQLRLTLLQVLD